MLKPSINIIGCGKLGKTIAKLLSDGNVVNVKGIVNATQESAVQAKNYIGNGTAYKNINELPFADIYFITTKDDLIKEIADKLETEKVLPKNAIIVHCSGSLSSDELKKTKDSQSYIASIHPIKSFANPDQACDTFSGTYCAMEGDKQATALLKDLFEKIGGIVFSIDKTNKKIYHAGGVMANNYLVTLHYHATQCYLAAGVDEEAAKKIVSMLMQDGLTNLSELSHHQALTGPIQRGDTNTIQQHISSLSEPSLPEKMRDIYRVLGQGTIELTSHQSDMKQKLRESLADAYT